MGNFGRDRILTLQGELMEDGIQTSIRKICKVLDFNRSNVYYSEKPKKKHVQTAEAWLVNEVRTVIEEFPEYETPKADGHQPYAYLCYVFDLLPKAKTA